MAKARGYVFTINNPTDDDKTLVMQMSEISRYIIVGQEVGEEGTPHYQGYVFFENPRSFTSVKKQLPRAHIEVAGGNPEQNKVYCSKQNNVLLEKGVCPVQGKRTDVQRVVEELQNGANLRSIAQAPKSLQSVKMAEVWLKYNETGRDWKPEVYWFHGETGSGKTRAAREWLETDIYTCLDSIKWFEGYDAHENVLIDDFRKDFCKFHQLLKLLDRYEYRVETKGGSRQFLAKKIAITSPYHPRDVYHCREDIQQLIRRIDKIECVGQYVCNEDNDVVSQNVQDYDPLDPFSSYGI